MANRQDAPEHKVCLNCGNAHILPGTPDEESAQMEQCRQQDIVALLAERAALNEREMYGD